MAFLNNLKSAQLPPIKNVLNVAWQTAKQTLPVKNKKQQYDDPTSEYGSQVGSSNISQGSQRPQNVRFADTVDEQPARPHELNPLNPFNNPNGSYGGAEQQNQDTSGYQYEETGFNQGEFNYQSGGFNQR